MPKFSIDYSELSNSVNKVEKRVYRLADVSTKLEKVAFDIVRFKDGNPDELWQIQSADDGDYIVARYDSEESKEEKRASKNAWEVLVSESSGDIDVFYKGHPIVKVALSELGIPAKDLDTVKRFLPKKLSSDKSFVKALLTTVGSDTKEELLKTYPELL